MPTDLSLQPLVRLLRNQTVLNVHSYEVRFSSSLFFAVSIYFYEVMSVLFSFFHITILY